jgi:hypothetical protein
MVELYVHYPYVFMAWFLIKHRDNFTFMFRSLVLADPLRKAALKPWVRFLSYTFRLNTEIDPVAQMWWF